MNCKKIIALGAAMTVAAGVLEGSSMLGLSQAEYDALSDVDRQIALDTARRKYMEAGADDVLLNLRELPAWIRVNA